MDYNFKIGNFICELRKENNLSQSELGELLGISNKAVSKWENGESMPKASMIMSLSKLLGVTSDELLSGERKITDGSYESEPTRQRELQEKLAEGRIKVVGIRFIYIIAIVLIAIIAALVYFTNKGVYEMAAGEPLMLGNLPSALICCGIATAVYLVIRFTLRVKRFSKAIVIIMSVVFSPALAACGAIAFLPVFVASIIMCVKNRKDIKQIFLFRKTSVKRVIAISVISVMLLSAFTVTLNLFAYTVPLAMIINYQFPVIESVATEYFPSPVDDSVGTMRMYYKYYSFEYPCDYKIDENETNDNITVLTNSGTGDGIFFSTTEPIVEDHNFIKNICNDSNLPWLMEAMKKYYIDKVGFIPDNWYNTFLASYINIYSDINLFDPTQTLFTMASRSMRSALYTDNIQFYNGNGFKAFIYINENGKGHLEIFPDYNQNILFTLFFTNKFDVDIVLNTLKFSDARPEAEE